MSGYYVIGANDHADALAAESMNALSIAETVALAAGNDSRIFATIETECENAKGVRENGYRSGDWRYKFADGSAICTNGGGRSWNIEESGLPWIQAGHGWP